MKVAPSSKRATGSDDLTDDEAELWYGTISVGTPATKYTGKRDLIFRQEYAFLRPSLVDFDTGSSDLFLPGPDCDSSCSGHTTYDPSSSSTSNDVGKTFSLSYGDGSTVSGEQYTDTVTIAGLTVSLLPDMNSVARIDYNDCSQATKQTLGAAKTYSSGFESSNFPADGLMGMGFKSISDYTHQASSYVGRSEWCHLGYGHNNR